MKLLFDQNLSHRLVSALASEYPDSVHVRDVGSALPMIKSYGPTPPRMA
jgi:predicted nuclease of predicted toxin-antitoxin system